MVTCADILLQHLIYSMAEIWRSCVCLWDMLIMKYSKIIYICHLYILMFISWMIYFLRSQTPRFFLTSADSNKKDLLIGTNPVNKPFLMSPPGFEPGTPRLKVVRFLQVFLFVFPCGLLSFIF